MLQLNRTTFAAPSYPSRIIQFGEGNFLRAFVDWQIDFLNEHTSFNSGVTVIRPINTDFPPSLNTQQGLYTTLIRGLDADGTEVSCRRVITCVNQELSAYQDYDAIHALAQQRDIRFVFSNTTEAGIAFNPEDKLEDRPPSSFPAKLTQLLWHRYQAFSGDRNKGLVIIPCELIDYNGQALKAIVEQYSVLWQLPMEFKSWLDEANTFCSTLVDRIVPGFPKEEIEQLTTEFNYQDNFVVSAENFYLFVIQGPQWLKQELCLDQLADDKQLNIKVVEDIKPYKERKVAILNGAHTALVPVAYQAGIDSVGESLQDQQLASYLKSVIFDEIIPTLSLPKTELEAFANEVENRFKNPFIHHLLLSISLNSMTKYKTRILPQLLTYAEHNQTPPRMLTFALAALITFYRGRRESGSYPLADDQWWLDFFNRHWQNIETGNSSINELVVELLANSNHWGTDLNQLPHLATMLCENIENIIQLGMRPASEKCQQKEAL